MEKAVSVGKRRLGRTDIEITPIGLGCWQFAQGKGLAGRFWSVIDQAAATATVKAALDGGISWFDTAEMYGGGRSETVLTTALHELEIAPEQVVIATKWVALLRWAGNIARTIDERLRCLQGYPINLHQVHVPWSLSPIPTQMREMARLFRDGKIRSVGVSNFSARQMEEANAALENHGLRLASNQVRINLLDRRIESNGVLDAARRLGVTLIAFSPLAQGILTGKFHENPTLVQSVSRMRKGGAGAAGRGGYTPEGLARTAPLVEELRRVAHAHGTTVSQVALSWLINFYGDTVVAIPGASAPQQAAENAGAMSLRLDNAEMSRLDELSRERKE